MLKNVKSILFADDTTIFLSRPDVPSLISEFVTLVKPLINWCEFNRLDLNWKKTYFMFIKNKRYDYPKEIVFFNNIIKVVDNFKLLGVEIDSKLSFCNFVTSIKKNIYIRLYSIKRLFHLSFLNDK